MLDDDLSDRTMPPTERHRREARERGQVARSAQLTSAVVLLAASLVLWSLASDLTTRLAGILRPRITTNAAASISIDSASALIGSMAQQAIMILSPFLLVVVIGGLLTNFLQVGWLWNMAAIQPRIRIGSFFSWDRVADSSGTSARLGVMALVTWRYIVTHLRHLSSIGSLEPAAMLGEPIRMLGDLSVQLSICLVLLALIDYGYRFWRNEQRLKMTVEERRREQREDSIDPRIKQQRSAVNGLRRNTAPLPEIGPIGAANN